MVDVDAPIVGALEVALRAAALIVLGFTSGYIFWQLYHQRIRPRIVWMYVGTVAAITFVWRTIVLLFVFFPVLRENFMTWITPITAAMYALGGLSLFILAFCASRRRRGDG